MPRTSYVRGADLLASALQVAHEDPALGIRLFLHASVLEEAKAITEALILSNGNKGEINASVQEGMERTDVLDALERLPSAPVVEELLDAIKKEDQPQPASIEASAKATLTHVLSLQGINRKKMVNRLNLLASTGDQVAKYVLSRI